MIHIISFVLKVEAEALCVNASMSFNHLISLNKSGKLKQAIFFPPKGKSMHHLKLQIVVFVCAHNVNKTLCFCKIKKTNRVLIMSRNNSQKLNLNSTNTCLTDMIHISIECYTLLL